MPALVGLADRATSAPTPGATCCIERIASTRPAAVLVSASLSSSLTRVARQIAAVTATGTPVIAGGAAFDEGGVRASRLGASAYAASPEEARAVLERLPDVVIPQPAPLDDEAVRLAAMADTMARQVLDATEGRLAAGPDALTPDHWRVVLATFTPHLVASVAGGVMTADPTVPAAARQLAGRRAAAARRPGRRDRRALEPAARPAPRVPALAGAARLSASHAPAWDRVPP